MDIRIEVDKPRTLKYDESLFEVYCLDYGDNYHRKENEPTSEFERSVRNLKARYKDLHKFNDALSIYFEWMDYLAEKHGGYDILKRKIKDGVLEDYVPRKPRLKNIKKLKYMYKHNIMLSRVGKRLINEDNINEYLSMYYPDDCINSSNINMEVTFDKDANKLSKDNNGITSYKSKSFISDAEFLESFFASKNKQRKKSSKKSKSDSKPKTLISDIMKADYQYDVEESDNAPLMTYNGLLLSAGTTKDIDMYHKLDESGWQSYKLMKRANYSKRMTSVFKAQKKSKKKKKKKDSQGYDELLIDIMTDNGYDDFEDFQKEMLSMTSKDVFK